MTPRRADDEADELVTSFAHQSQLRMNHKVPPDKFANKFPSQARPIQIRELLAEYFYYPGDILGYERSDYFLSAGHFCRSLNALFAHFMITKNGQG
jgi:hypothetical protein